MKKVIIIGGGPAGMMAAIQSASCGCDVTIVEKNEKLGKKLFITGKGRCNLTNACDISDLFSNVISNPKFLYSAFYSFTNEQVVDFFNMHGLPTKVERGKRVFPASDKSSDVIRTLEKECKRLGVAILLHTEVKKLQIKESEVTGVVLKNQHTLPADKVIVATGGCSYVSTGSTGDGYEFAKEFYADAYKAAVEIVGGEQYILSAVMHADERNRAMSEALGEDVYHYHLHVVYIPVVEKQILWSKRCKDESLRGTVKETITQVSRSKKWESKPVLNEDGNPMLNAKGKKILKSSYSVLQDDFFNFMRNAGYTDVERGECGSTEEHLTVTQFKVQAEQQRLEAVTGQVAQAEQSLADAKAATEKQKKKLEALKKETQAAKSVAMTAHEIESMGKKNPITGNVTMTADECRTLKDYAVSSFAEKSEKLKYKQKFEQADKNAKIWKDRFEKLNKDYEELKQKAQPFLDAIEIASEKVWAFINAILARGKELYEHKHPARNRGQDMEI